MEFLHIQISEELKEELKKESKKNGLSLNGYIRMVLIEKLNSLKNKNKE